MSRSGWKRCVAGVVHGKEAHTAHQADDVKRWTAMTALGAAIYGGFFALAALWLFLTSEDDQLQEQELSNSDSFAAGPLTSSSMLVSHSSQK